MAFVPGALASFRTPTLSQLLFYPLFFLVLMLLGGPLFEEPGWRGFALPRLQRRWGALDGSAILGILWAGWHLPHYLLPSLAAENGGFTPQGIGVFVLSAVSSR